MDFPVNTLGRALHSECKVFGPADTKFRFLHEVTSPDSEFLTVLKI